MDPSICWEDVVITAVAVMAQITSLRGEVSDTTCEDATVCQTAGTDHSGFTVAGVAAYGCDCIHTNPMLWLMLVPLHPSVLLMACDGSVRFVVASADATGFEI